MRFACWITKATDTHSEYVIHKFHVVLRKKIVMRTCLSIALYVQCLCCNITYQHLNSKKNAFFPSFIYSKR